MPFDTDRHENIALRLDDLAAQLDAGLPIHQIVGQPVVSIHGLAANLTRYLATENAPLDDIERVSLACAETAGSLPSTLRRLAAARRERGQLQRQLRQGLYYPVAVILTGGVILTILGPVFGVRRWLPPLVLAGMAALGVLAWRTVANRVRNDPGFRGRGLGLGSILGNLGECSYLASMHDLYEAGIPLPAAHEHATRACPVAWVRSGLFGAGQKLHGHDHSLADALSTSRVLSDESLSMLQTAERAGDLGPTFARLARRRRELLSRQASGYCRLVARIAYGAAVLFVAFLVFSFYTGLYARVLSR